MLGGFGGGPASAAAAGGATGRALGLGGAKPGSWTMAEALGKGAVADEEPAGASISAVAIDVGAADPAGRGPDEAEGQPVSKRSGAAVRRERARMV